MMIHALLAAVCTLAVPVVAAEPPTEAQKPQASAEAAQQPPPNVAGSPTPTMTESGASELASFKSLRDPFKRPAVIEKAEAPRSELELIPVEQLTMVGVLTGVHNKNRALVKTSTGKVFVVREGTRVGPQNGYVKQILEDRVIINETLTDIIGEKEIVRREIKLVSRASTLERNSFLPQVIVPPEVKK